MPTISLVCATKGRTKEVEQLLDSLAAQRHASMEVVIVDQNQDARLLPIIDAFRNVLDINHIQVAPRGVSAARNAGFRAARGRIVSFPDDDCWYPSTLVRDVEAWFSDHPEYKILAVGCTDQTGVRSGNRWFQEECDLKVTNSLRTTMCPTMFFDCTPEMRKVFFDESLNFGEDTDFCLRQLKTGIKGRLDSKMNIYHPVRDMLSGTVTADRADKYGSGMGVLVRRHATVVLWAALLAYDLLRAALVACRGRMHDASIVVAHARGLTRGYLKAALTGDFRAIEKRQLIVNSDD